MRHFQGSSNAISDCVTNPRLLYTNFTIFGILEVTKLEKVGLFLETKQTSLEHRKHLHGNIPLEGHQYNNN